jgi:hypothetical protein
MQAQSLSGRGGRQVTALTFDWDSTVGPRHRPGSPPARASPRATRSVCAFQQSRYRDSLRPARALGGLARGRGGRVGAESGGGGGGLRLAGCWEVPSPPIGPVSVNLIGGRPSAGLGYSDQ